MWIFDPKIPLGLWWAMALAAAAAIVWYALRRQWSASWGRRTALTLLLALGVVGPLLIALNPTWVTAVPPPPGAPLLSVLVDGTMSMQTEDAGEGGVTSRWRSAVHMASQVESDGTIEVRKQAFADSVQPLPSDALSSGDPTTTPSSNEPAGSPASETRWPQGHRTDLAAALRQTTRSGTPLGHAVLLITDGAHNAGTVETLLQSAREANALATPVYTVTLGTSLGMKNMSITAKTSRMIAFHDNPLTIGVRIGHSGLTGQSTELALIRNDQILQSQRVRLADGGIQEVRFTVDKGIQSPVEQFRIAATEVPGEATTADNQTVVLVQRLNAPIGVLVLEGKPYWDSKFLSRNLARDPVVDLTAITQVGPARFMTRKVTPSASNMGPPGGLLSVDDGAGTNQPSAARDEWSIETELASPLESTKLLEAYRVVILGRDANVFLTDAAIENLRLWIAQSGGCLLCARGAPADKVAAKLSEILPVRWGAGSESRFRTQLSRHGIDSTVFDPLLGDGSDPLGALPSLAAGAAPKVRIGLPQVLVESAADGTGEPIPVVTYQPYGRGQTVVVEGAGMWRWAFLPPQHAEKDAIYPTLWQSMIQWIVSQQDVLPGQEVAIRADRASFLSGDRATASVMVREPAKWQSAKGSLDLAVIVQGGDEKLLHRLPLVPSGMEDGLYRVEMGSLPVGYYSLKVVTGELDDVLATSACEVRDPWFESLEIDARPDIMRQVARLSGGEELRPEDVATLVKRFADKLKQSEKREETRTTMWDNPLAMLAVLACWIGTWIVRRQYGLI